MNIRPAASSDIPALLAPVRRYWHFEGIEGFTALRMELVLQRLLGDPRWGLIWVAESEGQLQSSGSAMPGVARSTSTAATPPGQGTSSSTSPSQPVDERTPRRLDSSTHLNRRLGGCGPAHTPRHTG